MKKSRLFICIMLSALCMTTLGCKTHDDDDDDNPVNPTPTSLIGSTWRYDQGQKLTALINFSSQRFVVSVTEFNHDSYETTGSYSYDGETLDFTYDETTYRIWCTKKSDERTLANTKWISETTYGNGRTYTGTLEFYSDGSFISNDFLDLGNYTKKSNAFYSYDGQTIKFTDPDRGSASLQCGAVLYKMSGGSNTGIW